MPLFKDQDCFLKHFNRWSFTHIQLAYLEGMLSYANEVVDYLAEQAIIILKSDTHVNIIDIRQMCNKLIT